MDECVAIKCNQKLKILQERDVAIQMLGFLPDRT